MMVGESQKQQHHSRKHTTRVDAAAAAAAAATTTTTSSGVITETASRGGCFRGYCCCCCCWWCQLPIVFVVFALLFGFGSIVGSTWLLGETEYYRDISTTADGAPQNEDVAVFYHIYIPPNKGRRGYVRTQEIVQEQIDQIGKAARIYGKRWVVHYTTTGEQSNRRQTYVTKEWLEQVACRKHTPFLRCVPNGPHKEIGSEEITLHALYRYCRRHHKNQNDNQHHHSDRHSHSHRNENRQQPRRHLLQQDERHNVTVRNNNNHGERHHQSTTVVDIPTTPTKTKRRIVIYLHSKGTYHSAGGRNDVWRRALTHAATHTSCLASLHHHTHHHTTTTTTTMTTENASTSTTTAPSSHETLCNVCGLQFYPLWTNFYPGNMFAADCSYVRHLLDPLHEFPKQLANVVHHVNRSSSYSSSSSSRLSSIPSSSSSSSPSSPSSSQFRWTHELYNFSNPGNTGLDRYSSEHWIASHPLIRPCDIQGNNTTLFVERLPQKIPDTTTTSTTAPGQALSTNGQWWWSIQTRLLAQPAPRVSIHHGNWFRLNLTLLELFLASSTTTTNHTTTTTTRQQQPPPPPSLQGSSLAITTTTSTIPTEEYFLLPGLLYRHHQVYRTYPPKDSWIWKWYPHGQVWFDKIYPKPNVSIPPPTVDQQDKK